jgi:hypothetical protein
VARKQTHSEPDIVVYWQWREVVEAYETHPSESMLTKVRLDADNDGKTSCGKKCERQTNGIGSSSSRS